MAICRAMVPIGDPMQATGERKSRPVETGLTGRAATALVCISIQQLRGYGGMPPRKKFRGYDIDSETFWGQNNAFRRPDNRVLHV